MFHINIRSIVKKIIQKPRIIEMKYSALTDQSKIKEEIDSALEIEANLFENSSQIQYRPSVVKKFKGNKVKPLKNFAILKKSLSESKELKIIDDQKLGLKFARLRSDNLMFSNLLTFLRSRKRRDKNRQIIVEGKRLIVEALKKRLQMKSLFFSDIEVLREIKDEVSTAQSQNETKVFKIAHHDLKTWSTLSTPPGLLAIFDRPNLKLTGCLFPNQLLPITVVCDNIREPNNLGSIIRTCAAIPCYQVIVTKGCCDPWDDKALRGGCGGQFRINIRDDVEWENILEYIPSELLEDYKLFIAESNVDKARNFLENKSSKDKFVSYSNIKDVGSHNIVVIGGETHGTSPEAYRFFENSLRQGIFLHIPLAEGSESLNVNSALTLILFELRKLHNIGEIK